MTLAFPPSLPAPKVNGYQVKQRNNKIHTVTAQGYQRSRQRFTGKVYDVLVTIGPITSTQLATFRTFYETTTESGALEFDWYDYSTTPKTSATFKFSGDTSPDVTAVAGPSASEDSYWNVSFALERRS